VDYSAHTGPWSHKSSTNFCHGWRVDLTAPRESEIITELLSRVTRGFDSPHRSKGVINHQWTAVTSDPRIRKHRQPLGSQKSSTNCCHWWRVDSTAHTAPKGVINHQRTAVTSDVWIRHHTEPTRDSEMSNELLSRVTRGFDIPHSPLGTQKWPTNCYQGWRVDSTA